MAENTIGSGSLGVLDRLAQLQSAPLIPPDNPLMAIGAILSGFGAGMKGQTNPILDRLQALRQQDLQAGLSTVGMRLNVDTAREAARHTAVTEKHAEETLALQKQTLATSLGNQLLDKALQLRDPTLAAEGYSRLADSGVLPAGYRDPKVLKEMAQKAIDHIDFRENAKGLAAKAVLLATQDEKDGILGAPNSRLMSDPELTRLAPEYQKTAQTPLGRATLQTIHGFSDSGTQVAEQLAKKTRAEFAGQKADAEKELLAATGKNYFLLDKTPEQIATFTQMLRDSKQPIPPSLASVESRYFQKFNAEMASSGALTKLHDLQGKLAKEALELKKKNASLEELGAYLSKLEKLATGAGSAMFIQNPDLKQQVTSGFISLADDMKSYMAKRAMAQRDKEQAALKAAQVLREAQNPKGAAVPTEDAATRVRNKFINPPSAPR